MIGALAEPLTEKQCFPYEKIPHFPVSTVKGHVGQLVFGLLQGVPIMCMQGRFHYYEGYPICKVGYRVIMGDILSARQVIELLWEINYLQGRF
jgi:purine-nucleoside phosphorylase